MRGNPRYRVNAVLIELDKEGAEYMLLISSAEIMQFHEFIGAVAKIFDQAGATWTVSTEAYEATNAGIQIGSSDLAGDLVNRIVAAAEKLKAAAAAHVSALRFAPNHAAYHLNYADTLLRLGRGGFGAASSAAP